MKKYFGGADGDGLNMQFDFPAMQALYLSLAREDARPLEAALRKRPSLDITSQWANFVRNHDELTLDKLSDEERQDVFDAFGPEPDMQLYGRGLRRRLPRCSGATRAGCVSSTRSCSPCPAHRCSSTARRSGWPRTSRARQARRPHPDAVGQRRDGRLHRRSPRKLTRPFPDGLYSPERVNVADQRHDHDSLWWFIRNLIRLRRRHPELGWSTVEVPRTKPQSVLAHLAREEDGWTMLALHNLAPESCLVDVSIGEVEPGSTLVDLVGEREEHPVAKDGRAQVKVDGYGFRWLLLRRPGDRPPK